VQRLDLARYDVKLQPGIEYRWHVAIIVDPNKRAADIVASGTIQYLAPSAALNGRLAQSDKSERYRVYAEEGYWYDALAGLSEWIDAQPKDAALRSQRAALLEQVGLQEVAAFDNRR
jgi:hypothetical protein